MSCLSHLRRLTSDENLHQLTNDILFAWYIFSYTPYIAFLNSWVLKQLFFATSSFTDWWELSIVHCIPDNLHLLQLHRIPCSWITEATGCLHTVQILEYVSSACQLDHAWNIILGSSFTTIEPSVLKELPPSFSVFLKSFRSPITLACSSKKL